MAKIVISADFEINPHKLEEWKKVFPECVALSRAEPGTETYIGALRRHAALCTTRTADRAPATAKADDPTFYRFFEIYSSREAFDTHKAGAGFALISKFIDGGGLAKDLVISEYSLTE
jgi:quinol monooxygenase YgiN